MVGNILFKRTIDIFFCRRIVSKTNGIHSDIASGRIIWKRVNIFRPFCPDFLRYWYCCSIYYARAVIPIDIRD